MTMLSYITDINRHGAPIMEYELYAIEKSGSITAARMLSAVSSHKSVGAFNVVTCAYAGTNRVFPHRTLKAAIRTLASVCDSTRGKLHRRGEFAACIVTPENRIMNLFEARKEAPAKN